MRWLILGYINGCLWLFSGLANAQQPQSLSDFAWQYRLLVIQVDSTKDLTQLQTSIEYHRQDISARKLLLLVHFGSQQHTQILGTSGQHLALSLLHKELAQLIKQHPNSVLLVGLDGGIKKRYEQKNFNLEQAFADIDLMPMRRWEVNKKQ